jgi:hypothetical protein
LASRSVGFGRGARPTEVRDQAEVLGRALVLDSAGVSGVNDLLDPVGVLGWVGVLGRSGCLVGGSG